MTLGLWADIGIGLFPAAMHLVGFAINLCHQRRGPLDPFAPIQFIQTDPKLGAKGVQLAFVLVEQVHRGTDNLIRVGKPAAFDLLMYSCLNIWSEMNAHLASF